MKHPLPAALLAGLVFAAGASAVLSQQAEPLADVASFAAITDERARSAAMFTEMNKVVSHPRCMNCHPVDDSPRQGDAMSVHVPPVQRGADDMGVAGMRCSTCHGADNVAYAGQAGSIPGHEPWALAPRSMGWIGLSPAAICEQLKDPARNGGRTLADIHEHMAEDGLVGWGWTPGPGRTPAPGTQASFGALVQGWIDSGAHCPSG